MLLQKRNWKAHKPACVPAAETATDSLTEPAPAAEAAKPLKTEKKAINANKAKHKKKKK